MYMYIHVSMGVFVLCVSVYVCVYVWCVCARVMRRLYLFKHIFLSPLLYQMYIMKRNKDYFKKN